MTSSVADGSHVFLEHVHSLWKHDRGESPPSVTVSDGGPAAEIVKGKFRGKFEWPFSFPFPSDFPYFGKRKGSGETLFTTPQTLMERGVNATIIYEVIVKVISGLFRNKHKFVFPVICSIVHTHNLTNELWPHKQDHRQCPLRALVDQPGATHSTM